LPDVDTDICHDRRHEVIEFLQKKYNSKFCKLSILSTLQSKALIKDVAKCVESFSEEQAKAVSDTIPVLYGRVFGLEEAEKNSEKFKEFTDTHKDIYKIAKKLYGLPKSVGSHASAFLVCYDDLDSFMPCQVGTDNEMITSLDMTYAQTSAIKLDLLGLQAVTLIDAISKNVGIDHNDIDVNSYEDVYKYLKDLQYPYGLFQISGDCNYRVVRDIRPRNLDQLSAVVAIARPGALAYLDEYANFTNNGEGKSVHEFFDDILGITGGQPLYQEQTLAMAVKMGFSVDDAESLRRLISKKDREKMAEWYPKIREKVEQQKLDPAIADLYISLSENSASYSFNKCLSPDTVIDTSDGDCKLMFEVIKGEWIKSYDPVKKELIDVQVKEIYENRAELFEVEFEDGKILKCSMDHEIMCEDGIKRKLKEVLLGKYKVFVD
jgi:DNA polymerase-3 subunit alpha